MTSYALQTPPWVAHANPPGPICTIATPDSTTKLVSPYFPKKPQQQTTPQNCPSLFLSFYTTKFSIQPNYNPTRWNVAKKFQMDDDKKKMEDDQNNFKIFKIA